MRAVDVMTVDPVSISPDESIVEAIRLMLQRKFSGFRWWMATERSSGSSPRAIYCAEPRLAPSASDRAGSSF